MDDINEPINAIRLEPYVFVRNMDTGANTRKKQISKAIGIDATRREGIFKSVCIKSNRLA